MKIPILLACLFAIGLAAPAGAASPAADRPAAGGILINDHRWTPPQRYLYWPPLPDGPWYDRHRGRWYGPAHRHHRAPYFAPYRARGILPLGIVLFKLQRFDYPRIAEIRLRDGVYKVRAIDRFGRPVRLTIDPATGEILDLRRRR